MQKVLSERGTIKKRINGLEGCLFSMDSQLVLDFGEPVF